MINNLGGTGPCMSPNVPTYRWYVPGVVQATWCAVQGRAGGVAADERSRLAAATSAAGGPAAAGAAAYAAPAVASAAARVLERDRHACRWTVAEVECALPAAAVALVVPWREGGALVDGNARSGCGPHSQTGRGLVSTGGGLREQLPGAGHVRRLAHLLEQHGVDPQLGRRRLRRARDPRRLPAHDARPARGRGGRPDRLSDWRTCDLNTPALYTLALDPDHRVVHVLPGPCGNCRSTCGGDLRRRTPSPGLARRRTCLPGRADAPDTLRLVCDGAPGMRQLPLPPLPRPRTLECQARYLSGVRERGALYRDNHVTSAMIQRRRRPAAMPLTCGFGGGAKGIRTPDPLPAEQDPGVRRGSRMSALGF